MLEHYKTIYEGGEGELVEKKSRFIATVRPVETEEEALAFIEEMKKKYWDARHNCYVYSVGMNREATRCSDDGEPSGTAGRPMLDVLLGAGIYNAAIVVTFLGQEGLCGHIPVQSRQDWRQVLSLKSIMGYPFR